MVARKLKLRKDSSNKRKSPISSSSSSNNSRSSSSSSSSSSLASQVLFWILSSSITFYGGSLFSYYSYYDEIAKPTIKYNDFATTRSRRDTITTVSTTGMVVNPTTYTIDKNNFVCQGFFSVLSIAFGPNNIKKNACSDMYVANGRYKLLLEEQNRQMIQMNTTLTLFTTWTQEQLDEPGCHLDDLPAVIPQQFDPVELLRQNNYTEAQIDWIQNWYKAAYAAAKKSKQKKRVVDHNYYARLADVWRILLAKQYHMAYADLDMMYLSHHPSVYLKYPNVAVPVWREQKGSLEIQNSGFCFTTQQLDVIIKFQQQVIESKGPQQAIIEQYSKYTELGPDLFQRAIQEIIYNDPIRFYLTSSDHDANVRQVIEAHSKYKFVWLHLDSRFRGGNMGNNLTTVFQNLRTNCTPPTIEEIFPSSRPHL